jgi:hypothetical protein
MFDKNSPIEHVTQECPRSVRFLMEKGIRCIACGEPIWGTLESAMKEKGFSDSKIDQIVQELNKYCTNQG